MHPIALAHRQRFTLQSKRIRRGARGDEAEGAAIELAHFTGRLVPLQQTLRCKLLLERTALVESAAVHTRGQAGKPRRQLERLIGRKLTAERVPPCTPEPPA